MKIGFFLLLLAIAFTPACKVVDDTTNAISVTASTSIEPLATRQVELPFENPFPNRWNPSNDGTPYEPCVAFSDEELARFGVDPSVIEDAALVDGQGIRGCNWYMPDKFSLGVVVTNAVSLERYKAGKPELEWRPDLSIRGRVVGLADLKYDETSCATYVQSFDSIVIFDVMRSSGVEARERYDPCAIVTEFTTAYLDRVPE